MSNKSFFQARRDGDESGFFGFFRRNKFFTGFFFGSFIFFAFGFFFNFFGRM